MSGAGRLRSRGFHDAPALASGAVRDTSRSSFSLPQVGQTGVSEEPTRGAALAFFPKPSMHV